MHDRTDESCEPARRRLVAAGLGTAALGPAGLAGLASLPGLAATARAQEPAFPTQPIRVVLPFGPGGLADISMRLVAQKLSERLGQQVIVDNRPGAGGTNAATTVLNAPRNGHTLALFANGTAISTSLFKLPYNPETDFMPISSMAYFDLILLVRNDGPIRDLKSLLAEAGRRELNIGTINPGSTQNLSAELFRSLAGIKAVIVPFKGTPEILTALIRGDVDVAFESYAALKAAVDAKQVRAIAATGPRRSAWLPDVPTVREAGLPNYEVTGWNALYAPAGTPPAAIRTLAEALRDAVGQPEIQRRFLELGTEPRASTPEEMARVFRSDAEKWGQVIKQAGIERQ
ncbi:MAG: Bug family tripartite tricarboxylate transporter substrate binding protein [Lautropia sp.]